MKTFFNDKNCNYEKKRSVTYVNIKYHLGQGCRIGVIKTKFLRLEFDNSFNNLMIFEYFDN